MGTDNLQKYRRNFTKSFVCFFEEGFEGVLLPGFSHRCHRRGDASRDKKRIQKRWTDGAGPKDRKNAHPFFGSQGQIKQHSGNLTKIGEKKYAP